MIYLFYFNCLESEPLDPKFTCNNDLSLIPLQLEYADSITAPTALEDKSRPTSEAVSNSNSENGDKSNSNYWV